MPTPDGEVHPTSVGPKARAGLKLAPVSGPAASMAAASASPTANPPSRGARGSAHVPQYTNTQRNAPSASTSNAPDEVTSRLTCGAAPTTTRAALGPPPKIT